MKQQRNLENGHLAAGNAVVMCGAGGSQDQAGSSGSQETAAGSQDQGKGKLYEE